MHKFLSFLRQSAHLIPRSFYDRAAYQTVLYHRIGKGLGYAFFLAIFMAAIVSIAFFIRSQHADVVDAESLMNDLPIVTIERGIASTDLIQPVTIPITHDGELQFHIEALSHEEISLSDLEAQRPDNAIVLAPRAILFVVDGKIQNVQSLENVKDIVIDEQGWQRAFDFMRRLPLIMMPIMAIGLWLGYVLQMFFLALVTYIITASNKMPEFPFDTRMRLAALALTPALVLNTIASHTLSHSMHPIIVFGLSVLYLFFGLYTSAKKGV